MRTLAIASVVAASLVLAPAALADNVGISLSPTNPEQGIPVTITLAGNAGAIDSDGDGAYLYAVARPSGGVGCQSSFGADQEAAGDASTVLVDGDEQDPTQPFSEQTSFDPDQGGSIVSAWLETDGDDGDDIATPDEVTAGPISTSFTASDPQVGPLKVSVPSSIKVGQAYNITYSTQTDQDVSLDSIVIPAGGSGCASSYELELDDVSSPDDIFGGTQDIYGTASTPGIDTESTAGTYTICSWIEGPDDQEVDATNATNVKVGSSSATTSGSSGSTGPNSGTTTGKSTTTSASGTPACIVPKYSGTNLTTIKKRLRAAGCVAGSVHYATTHKAKAGRILKLGYAAGKQLKHDATVGITVARA